MSRIQFPSALPKLLRVRGDKWKRFKTAPCPYQRTQLQLRASYFSAAAEGTDWRASAAVGGASAVFLRRPGSADTTVTIPDSDPAPKARPLLLAGRAASERRGLPRTGPPSPLTGATHARTRAGHPPRDGRSLPGTAGLCLGRHSSRLRRCHC